MPNTVRETIAHLSIGHLRNFLYVAQTLSFKEAADKAARSQPAVSLSIREMEQRLGGELFDRKKNLATTPLGEYCVPVVKELLIHYDAAVRSMTAHAAGFAGEAVVSVVPSVADLFAQALIEFMASYPEIKVRLISENSKIIRNKVLRGEVDFGVCAYQSANPLLSFTRIRTEGYGLVCPHGHELAGRGELEWSDLLKYPLIGSELLPDIELRKKPGPLIHTNLTVSSFQLMLKMVENGLGITVIPELAMPRHECGLSFVKLCKPTIQREVGILKSVNRRLSTAASRLEACLLESID